MNNNIYSVFKSVLYTQCHTCVMNFFFLIIYKLVYSVQTQ